MALEPITRQEQIIAGKDLEPITRMEKFLKKYGGSGGSGGGVSSWNDLTDKPFWVEYVKVPMFDGKLMTVETADNGTFIMAQGLFGVYLNGTNYVVFDGVEYECEPYYDDMMQTYGIGSLDFSKYPFFIINNLIVTQTAGTHTVVQYVSTPEVKTEYCPHLVVITKENADRTPYLEMEDVEKIVDAFKKGVPIVLKTVCGGLGVTMRVDDATSSFIYASGTVGGSYGIVEHMHYLFNVQDGSLYDSGVSHLGSVREQADGSTYPIMYIGNVHYKITVNADGTLSATQVRK